MQNVASGHEDAIHVRERLLDGLKAAGVVAEFVSRADNQPLRQVFENAATRARELGATLVAIGGDGTVNLAACAAIEHDLPLGLIPAGTYNFVARAHGIPEDTDAALELLLGGRARATRVAHLNGRPFLVNASIGLYAKLLSERETFTRRLGRRRAVASLAATVSALRRYRPLELAINQRGHERRLEASTFIVGNNSLQLELVGVAAVPGRTNRELSAVILHPVDRTTLLAMIWRGWRGEVAETRELETYLFETLQVDVPRRRARRITVAVDGEIVRETLPLTISTDMALRLVRPALETSPS